MSFQALLGVALDAETIDAARIHTDDALAVEDRPDGVDGATTDDGVRGSNSAPAGAIMQDRRQRATKATSPAIPSDDLRASSRQRDDVVVSLPIAPPGTELELARSAMSAAGRSPFWADACRSLNGRHRCHCIADVCGKGGDHEVCATAKARASWSAVLATSPGSHWCGRSPTRPPSNGNGRRAPD